MNTYTTYQPTNITWLGDIPSHWELSIGMTVLKENKRSNKGMKENTVLSLSYGEIIIKDESKLFGLVPESFETYQIVELNDIIIRCTDLQNDKTSLRTGLAKNKGIITSAYLNLGIKQGFNPKFIHYYLHTLDITKVFYGLGSGLRQNLSYLDFKRLPMAIPPLPEQTAIANYLDAKTAQIQKAVRLKQEQISLLKEYRQALINQTVTQGLNPSVPMKNSGIEWLGDVPEHWEVKKLKFVADIVLGKMLCTENKGGFFLKPYLKSKNIQWLNLDLSSVDEMWFSNYEMDLYRLKKGDLIVSEGGEVGKTCMWNEELKECYIQNSAHKVRFNNKNSSKYFLYVFFTYGYLGVFNSIVSRVSIAHLTKEKLSNIEFPIPPLTEQTAIADYLDVKTAQIDTALATYQAQIDKLNEYQRSLVNDVVTGKIDVRTI